MKDASEAQRHATVPSLRPSEYTATLIAALRSRPECVRGARVLEIGSGSGTVLAALGTMGASALCGVDIEQDAIDASSRLLERLDLDATVELHRGDMWLPVAGRRFDLIVANLPHFPMEEPVRVAGRLPTWSSGGADGRWLLDPFIEGLPVHLAPGGHAFLNHNAFVGVERSRAIATEHGLSFAIVMTVLVYIDEEKLAGMTSRVLEAEQGRSLHRYGPYTFGEMHIVEIGAAA
jgi:methylase of polypeptide subunit release factors